MELTSHNLVRWFQLEYRMLVESMKKCNHHYDKDNLNTYHLESDVFTHTMMVLLNADRDNPKVYELKNELLVAALLHDIGKVFVRVENHEKKRVHFVGHDQVSAFLSLDVIRDIERDFKVELDKVLLFQAIALHTELFKLDADQLKERFIDNEKLFGFLQRLSYADQLGRFYDGESRFPLVNKIDCTKAVEKPHELIMMIGLPLSGKSTYLESNSFGGYNIISRDDIVMELAFQQGVTTYDKAWDIVDQKEVDKIFNNRLNNAIQNRNNIIVDRTNLSRKSRRKILNRLPKDYKKTAICLVISAKEAYNRGIDREKKGKSVPSEVYDRMIKFFYPPMYGEFDSIEWRVK